MQCLMPCNMLAVLVIYAHLEHEQTLSSLQALCCPTIDSNCSNPAEPLLFGSQSSSQTLTKLLTYTCCLQALCRTETAALGRCPEFTNRAFVLRLPCALDSCSSSDGSSSSGQGPRLLVSLFAAPSPEEPAGPVVAGGASRVARSSAVFSCKSSPASSHCQFIECH
jgi:hypothetical protein